MFQTKKLEKIYKKFTTNPKIDKSYNINLIQFNFYFITNKIT